MTQRTATLTIDGRSIELPILEGTLGPDVIDTRALGSHGYFTYDPGFLSTASCSSDVTFIDGDAGLLYYRGYPIEQLAEKSDFLEVSYLLLNGELPNAEQKKNFVDKVTGQTMLHDQISNFYRGFRRDTHPMAVMVGVVGAMSAFYRHSSDAFDPAQRESAAFRLIAKVPTIAAWSYKYNVGEPFMYPQNHLNYAENFLHMMFSEPYLDYDLMPEVVRALDLIFLLHADHEQNCSTATVRRTTSNSPKCASILPSPNTRKSSSRPSAKSPTCSRRASISPSKA
jgi:citrate synthase